jgi:SAM-dependent methyltransferase
MGSWEQIWRGDGAKQLWSVPDRRVLELVAKWKDSWTIRRVLDLGCGVGRHVYLLASLGFDAYGLDHSETGLETCGRRLQAHGLTAKLHCGEMSDIPFPDGYFDAVIAFNSIYHGMAQQVDQGVELVRRKLRVGGECFATFLSRDNRLYGKGEAMEPHTFSDPRMYKELLGGDGESGVTHHFSSEEEVRHFFRAYEIESLDHEELRLALPGKNGGAPSWLPIRKSYFWQIVARKVDSHA